MKSLLTTICGCMIVTIGANAQYRTLTLDELIPGGSRYRFAESLYGLTWWGDVCIQPDLDELTAIDPKTGERTLILTRDSINKALATLNTETKEKENVLRKYEIGHLYGIQFPWPEKKEILIHSRNKFIVYNFEANKIEHSITLDENYANSDYNHTSRHVAYTVGNNLYVDSDAVTNEPEGIVCGQSVHRNEFGINKGTFWSPKGNLLAFYRMDETMVTQYPLVDISTRIAEPRNIRYPMAGMTSHKVTVGIYDPASKQTIYLKAGDPTDRYFTNISWSPDEKSLYLIELNRDQNHSKLCQYSAETGELLSVLIEETHPKYVEPLHPITFLPWDSKRFIYQSQKDGFNHLYLYNTEGKLIKQLTSGKWLVQDILGFNEKKKEIIISSTENSPLQTNIFRVAIPSGKKNPVGNAQGVHYATASPSGQYLIDNYTSPEIPRKIELVTVQTNKTVDLLTAEDPYKDYSMPSIETGMIKAADDTTDLYYRIIKPADFDENKKYPVVIYVYGGPHAQMIHNTFRYDARGWDIYMASQGYIVFTLDNRGSSNRGLEFENCTFRQLGIEEGKDQVRGVEYLKSLPYIDVDRIGVHGWSYGGHMTTALMLRYPEIFKVGVAGGPVIDWSYYEIMYGERYMDTPESNPEGYDETNLKNLAGNLKGRLMLIHGDMDDTCVPQHTFSFMKASIEAKTYPDLFIYPGHAHNVMGKDRVHLHEKITRYFNEHLK